MERSTDHADFLNCNEVVFLASKRLEFFSDPLLFDVFSKAARERLRHPIFIKCRIEFFLVILQMRDRKTKRRKKENIDP